MSPEEMAAAMKANLKEKTGKSLTEWVKLAKKSGETKHGGIVKHLKGEHGLTHGYANLVAHEALGGAPTETSSGQELVSAMYAGPKAALLPIHEALMAAVKQLGKDVEVAPKKTYVSLRRSKQFALVQPSTKTRVDLGLVLKGVAPEGRLEASGTFNSMVTHRVRLEKKSDVDAKVKAWLKQAYAEA
mgnify:CR=1 FL=1